MSSEAELETQRAVSGEWEVDVMSSVKITVRNVDAVLRCVNNVDNWQGTFYDIRTVNDVMEHWAFNCAVNGVERVNRLDGWADLPDDAVTMELDRNVEMYCTLAPKPTP